MLVKIDIEKLEKIILNEITSELEGWEESRTLLGNRGKYQIQLLITRHQGHFIGPKKPAKPQKVITFQRGNS
jgi:hypothetical protein